MEKTYLKAEDWKNKGEFVPVFDKEIFVVDTKEHHKCLVILHGYPTSSYDYHKILPELSKHYRIIIHDLIGFGYSSKPDNYYFSISDQVDYALELWRILGLQNITILGHDYGTEIAQEIIAREQSLLLPFSIEKIILSNGNMPINHLNYIESDRTLKQNLSKLLITMLSSFGYYKKIIKDSFSDESKISDEEINEMWQQLSFDNGRELMHFVENHIQERKIFWNRWISSIEETKIPLQLIVCAEDKYSNTHLKELCSKKIANTKVHEIEDCGHYPMLENPDKWINCIIEN